jgi:hypothetical protein
MLLTWVLISAGANGLALYHMQLAILPDMARKVAIQRKDVATQSVATYLPRKW